MATSFHLDSPNLMGFPPSTPLLYLHVNVLAVLPLGIYPSGILT